MHIPDILGQIHQVEFIHPLINLGAVGVCLVALAAYFLIKDRKYEKRVDEMLQREESFREETAKLQETFRREQAEMLEKYREALVRFAQTLDLITTCLKNTLDRKGG